MSAPLMSKSTLFIYNGTFETPSFISRKIEKLPPEGESGDVETPLDAFQIGQVHPQN